MSFVNIRGLSKKFDLVHAVKDFTLSIEKGELVSFLGPSGCGKTTTLRMIAGFVDPTEGEIEIDEKMVVGQGINISTEERNLGMVFQSYAVWPHMTVYQNIAYPLKIKKKSKKEIKSKVEEVVKLVNLQDHIQKYPDQLSGGQQQRVALARALIMEPDVLLLDEALSNLDAKLRDKMRNEIKSLQKRTGVTIIFVTHDQIEALSMSDRIVVMNFGEIQQVGTPTEIYATPANEFVADFIGKANLLKGTLQRSGEVTIDHTTLSIPVNQPNAALTGDNVTVCYRPEQITIEKRAETNQNQKVGKLIGHTYLGNIIEYVVQVEGVQLKVETSQPLNLSENAEVSLQLPEPIIFS